MYAPSRRGMGDSTQPLTFPFVVPCSVGDIDPATGDTIAGCAGAAPPLPSMPGSSVTVAAQGYSAWLYVAAAGLGFVFLSRLVK